MHVGVPKLLQPDCTGAEAEQHFDDLYAHCGVSLEAFDSATELFRGRVVRSSSGLRTAKTELARLKRDARKERADGSSEWLLSPLPLQTRVLLVTADAKVSHSRAASRSQSADRPASATPQCSNDTDAESRGAELRPRSRSVESAAPAAARSPAHPASRGREQVAAAGSGIMAARDRPPRPRSSSVPLKTREVEERMAAEVASVRCYMQAQAEVRNAARSLAPSPRGSCWRGRLCATLYCTLRCWLLDVKHTRSVQTTGDKPLPLRVQAAQAVMQQEIARLGQMLRERESLWTVKRRQLIMLVHRLHSDVAAEKQARAESIAQALALKREKQVLLAERATALAAREWAETRFASEAVRAAEAEAQLVTLGAAVQGAASAHKRARASADVRGARAASQQLAAEIQQLRAQEREFEHMGAVQRRVQELEERLAGSMQRGRQNAAQLGIAKKKSQRQIITEGEKRQLTIRGLRSQVVNLARRVDSLLEHLRFLRSWSHTVRRKDKGGDEHLEFVVPQWGQLEGEVVQLPQLSACAPYGVKRQRRDGLGACGGKQVHALVLLLAVEISGRFGVGWERCGELIALVLRRFRICELKDLPSRAQLDGLGKASHKLNLLVCGRRIALNSADGLKCWGGDGSSIKKRPVIDSTLWYKCLDGATRAVQLGVRYSERETAQHIKAHCLRDFELLELNAREALRLAHLAVHGFEMEELQLSALSRLATIFNLRAVIGDRASVETAFARLISELMGCPVDRLICQMHAVDNAAKHSTSLKRVYARITPQLEALADAAGVPLETLQPPPAPTAVERMRQQPGDAGLEKVSPLLQVRPG